MKTCEDCGTPLSNGLCPNCQEEAARIEELEAGIQMHIDKATNKPTGLEG